MPVQELSQPMRAMSFRGVNLQLPPERLPSSDFQLADNMWIIGGELWTRPGKRGMFNLALPGAIYSLTAYAAADPTNPSNVTTWLMFVSSGKLYIAQAGQPNAPTEIKVGGPSGASFTLNSARVRMQRVGQWMYLVDGAGPLYKVLIPYVNPSTAYTAAQYVGLNAPTATFTASLTNGVIDDTADATKWASIPALTWPGSVTVTPPETFANVANSQFTGGAGSPSAWPTGWMDGGDTPGYQAAPAVVGGQEIFLDGGAGPEWSDWVHPVPTYPSGQHTITSARVWLASAYGHSSGGGAFSIQMFPEAASVVPVTLITYTDLAINSSGATSTISSALHPFQSTDVGKVVTVFSGTGFIRGNYTITAVNAGTHVATVNGNIGVNGSTLGAAVLGLDSGGVAGVIGTDHNNTLATPSSSITGANQSSKVFTCSNNNQKFTNLFSWSSLPTEMDAILMRIYGAASNTPTGVNTPSLKVVDVRLIAETSSTGTLHLKANDPVGQGANCLGGVWIKRDYTGDPGGYRDFSGSNTISVKYSAPATTPSPSTGGIPFRFGFLKPGQPLTAIAWSNIVSYTTDGAAFYCDCSTVDPTIRAQTAYLFIKIDTDLPATINPADLCTIGPISTSGNLTLHELFGGWGGDYTYQYTKMNATNDPVNFIDVVESDPSPMSIPPSQPNGVSNQVTFPLPANPGDGTTHWCIYRFGGVFGDGFGRLIARVSLTADQSADAQHQYTWNHTTRVFVDNTTDSSLEINTPTFLLTGRTPLPVGATALAEWQGHLVAAIGSNLYISWLIQGETGLYFNTINVNDTNDIAQAIKGAFFNTGGNDNDPIQNVCPLGPYLVVMKQRSFLLVTGTDAASFAMAPHIVRAGVGLTAPLGFGVTGTDLRYLGPDGVRVYNGTDNPPMMSRDIEPALNPKSRNLAALQPAAYAASFAVWHGDRFYLCAPGTSSDTTPTVLWVWDTRVEGKDGPGGWVRWLGCNFTSAASLTQSSNTDDLYFGGLDGQIYSFNGDGDTNLATDNSKPINYAFLGRAEGQEVTGTFGAEIMSPYYFNVQRPEYLQLNVVTQEATTLTLKVTAAATTASWQHAYVVNSTQKVIRKEIDFPNDGGVNCTPAIYGSSIKAVNIKRVALELSVGSPGEN